MDWALMGDRELTPVSPLDGRQRTEKEMKEKETEN